jgi:NAD(P)-dependent dehydrogenase (short-subunit alcohol dehydrogenase family)
VLDGKNILITGGARGLGAAFAEAACKAGGRVAIADILEQRGRETAQALNEKGHDVTFHRLDLAEPDSIAACADDVQSEFGGLDGLVNNGAIATGIGGKTMLEIDPEEWDRVMQVNARGPWLMTRACHGGLRAAGNGKVVNLASDTALWGAPRLMHYVASKGAVIAMTRAMANELGDDNIAVNAIAPGLTEVEATEYVPEARKELYRDGRAMQRTQMPEDVVGAVLFLLSAGADFITGQLLPVNGGFVFN